MVNGEMKEIKYDENGNPFYVNHKGDKISLSDEQKASIV